VLAELEAGQRLVVARAVGGRRIGPPAAHRASIVLGPHAVGAKDFTPPALTPLARGLGRLAGRVRSLPVPVPVLVAGVPAQFVHEDDVGEDDVGEALLACIVGAGPPGAYNLAGDGVLTLADIARELGLAPISIPAGPVRAGRGDRGRAAPAAGRGLGRGPPPPGDHGHDPGQA
jgi:hypothetical protein